MKKRRILEAILFVTVGYSLRRKQYYLEHAGCKDYCGTQYPTDQQIEAYASL